MPDAQTLLACAREQLDDVACRLSRKAADAERIVGAILYTLVQLCVQAGWTAEDALRAHVVNAGVKRCPCDDDRCSRRGTPQ
jgi:hypothetical protein